MKRSKRFKILAAGYAVVLAFITALLAVSWLGNVDLRPFSPVLALTFAAILAGPVALAFVWDRISRVKVFHVEIALSDVSARSSTRLAEEVREIQRQEAGPSMMPEILRRIRQAIDEVGAIEVLEVDLGTGESWWATRLYLLAALAADYTSIRSFVFVSVTRDRRKLLAGISGPKEVQQVLSSTYPYLEEAYRKARDCIAAVAVEDEIEQVVQSFGIRLYELKPPEIKNDEPVLKSAGAREWVTLDFVRQRFSADSSVVEWDGGPETALLRYRILDRPTPFVCLVEGGQLRKVVDRSELGARIAKEALSETLGGH
jgi:hypothetical protein